MDYLFGSSLIGFFLLIFICGYISFPSMHDSEPDTIVVKTLPQKFSDMLSEIGIESNPQEIGTNDVEKGEYYSRCFTQTPRMVTNKGSLEVKNSNIDVIQIIQKG